MRYRAREALLLLIVLARGANAGADDARIELAKALVSQLAAAKYAEAVETFDATMTKVLPPAKVQESWEGLIAKYGPLQSIGPTRTETIEPYFAVFVTMQLERGKLDAKVVYDNERKVAGFFFVPTGTYRPPAYADPAKFDEIEVTIGKGFWQLPGTLSLPRGDGPFPAVVLVHGSGPHDRDETIGPNKPFRDIAHGLASRGIAVLRYEKRTKHHQLKMVLLARSLTVKHETIDDAVAAIEVLAGHEKVDGKRIFVLGHSMGGSMIPRIAAASDRACGYICLAGSTRPLEVLLVEQTGYIFSLDGKIDDEEQKQIDKISQEVAKLKALTPDSGAGDILGAPASYWLDLQGYDPATAAKRVARPLLILQGERDYQVTLEDFEGWKRALSSRDDVTFKLFPSLNHLCVTGKGKSTPMEYMSPGNVDEEVIATIAEWLAKLK
jgi:dienelactone hydrolase